MKYFNTFMVLLLLAIFSCSDKEELDPNIPQIDDGPFSFFQGLSGSATYADFQPDGTLVYQGNYQFSTEDLPERGVYKIDKNGKLITGFDWTKDKSWWPKKEEFGFESWGIVRAHGDGVLMTGEYVVDGKILYMIRLKADGTLDRDFVGNVKFNSSIKQIAVSSDNRIFAVFGQNVVKLNQDGTLDNSFVFNREGSFYYGSIHNVVPMTDGKLYVMGGYGVVHGGYLWRSIVRFLPNGTVDTTFSLYEKLEQSLAPGSISEGYISEAIVQSDGRVLINGSFFRLTNEKERDTHYNYRNTACLLPNGQIDTSFKIQELSGDMGIWKGLNDSFYYRQHFVGFDHHEKLYHVDKNGNLLGEYLPDGNFVTVLPLSANETLVAGSFYLGRGTQMPVYAPLAKLKN